MTYDPASAFSIADIVDELTIAEESHHAGVQHMRAGDNVAANRLLERAVRHWKRGLAIGTLIILRDDAADHGPLPDTPDSSAADADAESRAAWRDAESVLCELVGDDAAPVCTGGRWASHRVRVTATVQVWLATSPAGQVVAQVVENGRPPAPPLGGMLAGWYALASGGWRVLWQPMS